MESNQSPTNPCAVCGCESLLIDEVAHQGRMLLAECPRCHHRWTQMLPGRALGRRVRQPRRFASTARRGRAEAA